jgi:alpha-galactosidase
MSRLSIASFVFLSLALARDATAQIQKPVMGYNSYNQLSCSPTDASISAAINSLSSKGFVAAGYQYFQIDCGWASRDNTRNSTNGAIKINTSAFPNGLLSLANLARSKGMQWTMYSDAGVRMCDPTSPSPVAGSLGHEAADAAFFASLGTVYVKCESPILRDEHVPNDVPSDDNCYADGATAGDNAPKNTRTDFPSRYGAMWNALKANNINSMLICQWGVPYQASSGLQGPNQWTQGISTSFRLSDDMTDSWSSVYRIYNQAIHIAASGLIRPGHHADDH